MKLLWLEFTGTLRGGCRERPTTKLSTGRTFERRDAPYGKDAPFLFFCFLLEEL